MLNKTEHEIYPAHNVKMPTTFGILTFIRMINITSESFKAINIVCIPNLNSYGQWQFNAQLS